MIGTLGILQAGAKQELLDLNGAVDRLRLTSFHISQAILDQIVKKHP